jgi:hypothetical protein
MNFLLWLFVAVVTVSLFGVSSVVAVIGFVLATLFGFIAGQVAFGRAGVLGFAADAPFVDLGVLPPPDSTDGPDPAYRAYLTGPVLREFRGVVVRGVRDVYRRVLDTSDGSDTPLRTLVDFGHGQAESYWGRTVLLAPCVAAGLGVWFGTIIAWTMVLAISVVFLSALSLLVGSALVTGRVLRFVESGLHRVLEINAFCAKCYERLDRPILLCPRCHRAHRHLVPGRAGVFRRTCACHATLPTLFLLGKHFLREPCPHCGIELPYKARSRPSTHIPVVAGTSAGKSVFMHSAVVGLRRDPTTRFEFADQASESRFDEAQQAGLTLDPGRSRPNAPGRTPVAHTFYFGRGTARRLVYVYDPAGEAVERADKVDELGFLSHAGGVVFIIDPFSLPAVRDRAAADTLTSVRPSLSTPETALLSLVETLGTARRTRQVAVVITKSDGLLTDPALIHPYARLAATADRHGRGLAVRDWLLDQQRGDLVRSLENRFRTVGYFAITALDAGGVTTRTSVSTATSVRLDDPAEPIRWLRDRRSAR